MKLKIKEGTTSKLVRVFIQDATSTTGDGLTGLVYNSPFLSAYFLPEGYPSPTAITLATMTVGTWATGGFKEVDATNMPGVYEIGLPDTVVDATSEGSVLVMLMGATNMVPVLLEIELDAIDYRNAAWEKLMLSALGIIAGTAQTGTLSTIQATTNLTGYADDELIGAVIVFTGGTAAGQRATITDYASASGLVMFDAIPTAPTNGDTFVIV